MTVPLARGAASVPPVRAGLDPVVGLVRGPNVPCDAALAPTSLLPRRTTECVEDVNHKQDDV